MNELGQEEPNRVTDPTKDDVVRRLSKSILVNALLLATAACASTQGAPSEEPAPERSFLPEGPPIEQPGDAYLMYYAHASGVRVRNTALGVDSVVIPRAGDVVGKQSPDNAYLALAYRRGDSTALVIVNGHSGAMSPVHAAGGNGAYTFAWATASDTLGVAYRPIGDGQSAVLIADLNGNVRDVGCAASNRFIVWRAGGQLVVRDARNIYTVDARNCNTLATLPMRGKTDIEYSYDGNRVVFPRDGSLYLASYNGAGAQQLAGAPFNPQNPTWSPDNRRIAFEIRSTQFRNITHVAVHDLGTGRVWFNAEERALGMPRDNNPCWSPRGDRLAHDREYQRRGVDGEPYVQKQKIITPASSEVEDVLLEELVRGQGPDAESCGWIDDQHLSLVSANGLRIFNLETKVAYEMPHNTVLLYARVLTR